MPLSALPETRAEYDAATTRAGILAEQLLPSIRRETQGQLAGFAREQVELREARMKERPKQRAKPKAKGCAPDDPLCGLDLD